LENHANQGFVRYQQSDGVMIPIINLRAVRERDEDRKAALAKALGEVCKTHGFFYVEDHGVSENLLALAQQAIRDFFNLPMEDKLQIEISRSPYHRGYVAPGEENAYGSKIKDLKEVFDMALELPLDDIDVKAGRFFHGPNTFPEQLPQFKPTLLWLYREWQALCEDISELMALALGLPNGFFIKRSQKPLAQLRGAKYPAQPQVDEAGPIGCGAHTDYGIVSIIWQIDVEGLEVQSMDGRWFRAPRIPGAFACPMGDAIGIWTNDYWRPTPHRVINASSKDRHSLSFFYDQDPDCLMQPLPAFVDETRPSRYAPTTMEAHVARGFNDTFEYRKSQQTQEGALS
jgi:isopenicillin N synthase-like dioxygenase